MVNVCFRDPVPLTRICDVLNDYDIGVFILPVNGPNAKYALPNKLFEFVQARLAIAVSPNPGMSAVVTGFGLGVVARDFTPKGMAAAIGGLSRADIKRYKESADHAAGKITAESNARIWRGIMRALTS